MSITCLIISNNRYVKKQKQTYSLIMSDSRLNIQLVLYIQYIAFIFLMGVHYLEGLVMSNISLNVWLNINDVLYVKLELQLAFYKVSDTQQY